MSGLYAARELEAGHQHVEVQEEALYSEQALPEYEIGVKSLRGEAALEADGRLLPYVWHGIQASNNKASWTADERTVFITISGFAEASSFVIPLVRNIDRHSSGRPSH